MSWGVLQQPAIAGSVFFVDLHPSECTFEMIERARGLVWFGALLIFLSVRWIWFGALWRFLSVRGIWFGALFEIVERVGGLVWCAFEIFKRARVFFSVHF